MRATLAFQLLASSGEQVLRELLNTLNAEGKMLPTFDVLRSHVRSIFPQEEQQMCCFCVCRSWDVSRGSER